MKKSFSSIIEFFIKPNITTFKAPITEKTKESAINLTTQFENIRTSHKINEINNNFVFYRYLFTFSFVLY